MDIILILLGQIDEFIQRKLSISNAEFSTYFCNPSKLNAAFSQRKKNYILNEQFFRATVRAFPKQLKIKSFLIRTLINYCFNCG